MRAAIKVSKFGAKAAPMPLAPPVQTVQSTVPVQQGRHLTRRTGNVSLVQVQERVPQRLSHGEHPPPRDRTVEAQPHDRARCAVRPVGFAGCPVATVLGPEPRPADLLPGKELVEGRVEHVDVALERDRQDRRSR